VIGLEIEKKYLETMKRRRSYSNLKKINMQLKRKKNASRSENLIRRGKMKLKLIHDVTVLN
jgi:hypothetical protein